MAKGTATCTCKYCGKTFEVSKTCYNRSDANNWESWAEAHYDECPECREARIQRERDAENQKSAENAAAAGYPELTGSAKQVAWANTIRDKFLSGEFAEENFTAEGKRFRAWLIKTQTKAADWIENRFSLMTWAEKLTKVYTAEKAKAEQADAEVSEETAEEAEIETRKDEMKENNFISGSFGPEQRKEMEEAWASMPPLKIDAAWEISYWKSGSGFSHSEVVEHTVEETVLTPEEMKESLKSWWYETGWADNQFDGHYWKVTYTLDGEHFDENACWIYPEDFE